MPLPSEMVRILLDVVEVARRLTSVISTFPELSGVLESHQGAGRTQQGGLQEDRAPKVSPDAIIGKEAPNVLLR